ncbi:hypothetical protein [Actinomycetospora chlora]
MQWEPTQFPDLMKFHTGSFVASRDFYRAALEDEDLRKLFPGFDAPAADDDLGWYSVRSYTEWQSGHGQTLQLAMLPDAIIHYSFALCRIKQVVDLGAILDQVKATLQLVRLLASGREANVAAVATLGNVLLPESSPVELPSLGFVYPWDLEVQAPVFSADGPPVTAILLTDFPEKLVQASPFAATGTPIPPKRNKDEVQRLHVAFRDRIEHTRLSFVLASEAPSIIAPVLCAWGPLDPTNVGQSHSYSSVSWPPMAAVTLTPDLATSVAAWSSKIVGKTQSLEIGVRRLLSAATSRADPLDGLIDAVMCWENLFGDTPETMFKVCGSLSRLLEPDDDDARARRFKRLRELYNTRSKLVHGASEPKLAERETLRAETIEVALDALRIVLTDEKLSNCKDAVERSKMMLLGFAK